MPEITIDDYTALAVQDNTTLAKWYCELNSWNWPEGLPDPEELRVVGSGDRRWKIMCWIEGHIGSEIISRAWNSDMSDEQFLEFWNTKGRFFHEGK